MELPGYRELHSASRLSRVPRRVPAYLGASMVTVPSVMSPAERRALLLLAGLAVAGHLLLAVRRSPDAPPGAVTLFPEGGDGDPLAHRARSVALATPPAPGERIDVDRAGWEELARLPGVGTALARRIVADRESRGAFGGSAGLDRVPGVGPGLLRRLAPSLSFGGRPAEATGAGGDAMVDINRAGVAELDALPGIGEARARAIVAFRDSTGPFRHPSDLRRVPGMTGAAVAALEGRLRGW